MWASWVKSPARIHNHNRAPSFDLAAADTSLPPPRSPLHHHSASFKDVETLLLNHPPYPPLSPLHKHSISYHKPSNPTRSPAPAHRQPISFKDIQTLLADSPGSTRKPSIFHRVRAWASATHRHHNQPPPDAQNRVVVYYTSLRVVRKTFDDCRAVRSILKGYKIKIDERDVSMDGGFLDELQRIIGKRETKKDLSLPRVYVNGVYVGGADEIRRLHENGDLKRLIEGLPAADGSVCGDCGGFRFVVCEECDGSHRVYREKINEMKLSRSSKVVLTI
ncbi:hypothetical protein Cgig2_032759 [Carnegiea gigantea]|uniref:Glutaredoxin domain-containing protein n=1 Tax=Carnegiea gigantea TaxID=171969 RepID=A0A9Q1KJ74_9CARY|nr:hypothetical protein Cgig2_032759 [Carnegiea gigantea]